MREILFRGECTETGDWVKGFYVRLYDDKGHESHRIYPGYAETDCGDYYPDCYEVKPKTVGQFTGLTDKNGKRIFEGDIIKTRHGIKQIVFEDGCFGAKVNDRLFAQLRGYNRELNGDWEVIGNIHDDPELMEKINVNM